MRGVCATGDIDHDLHANFYPQNGGQSEVTEGSRTQRGLNNTLIVDYWTREMLCNASGKQVSEVDENRDVRYRQVIHRDIGIPR